MSVCPGCGRCQHCGQRTAPVNPWYGPYTVPSHPQSPFYPTTSPNTIGPYFVGDPMPGALGTITVTC